MEKYGEGKQSPTIPVIPVPIGLLHTIARKLKDALPD